MSLRSKLSSGLLAGLAGLVLACGAGDGAGNSTKGCNLVTNYPCKTEEGRVCAPNPEKPGEGICVWNEKEDTVSKPDVYTEPETLADTISYIDTAIDTITKFDTIDTIPYFDTACSDNCDQLGKRKCDGFKIMECDYFGDCKDWKLVEECVWPSVCDESGLVSCVCDTLGCECDPSTYINSCNDLVLTYCDADKNKISTLDCQKEGMSHCDYVKGYDKEICFGDVGLGDECGSIYSDLIIGSDCDFYEMDYCYNYSYCTKSCEIDADCGKGWFCSGICFPGDGP